MARPSEETLLRKYGPPLSQAREKWLEQMRENGRLGGSVKGKPKGFAALCQSDPEKLKRISIKGGRLSRRRK